MIRLQLKNFRCFSDTGELELKPLTFIVGENSAGKTSLLAGARQLLEGFSFPTQNPFNREPYFLGGFDQIARQDGNLERAKTFSLSIAFADDRTARNALPLRHALHYQKGPIQPELFQYDLTAGDSSVSFFFSDTLAYRVAGSRETVTVPAEAIPPVEVIRSNLFVMSSLFELFGRFAKDSRTAKTLAALADVSRPTNTRYVRNVYASAPVRSQPQRTYTPSEMKTSSEGSHVPLAMARQMVSEPLRWKVVHDKILDFGKDSGLFDDLDIRPLGKEDGDPFQVMVRSSGPRVNLVDVGYGVSQALPIIYQLQEGNYDAFLLQQPEVHLHPRAQAALGTVLAQLSSRQPETLYLIETHSDYIIDRVRLEVANGRLDPNNVTLLFMDKQDNEVVGQNLYLNKNGEIKDAPDRFRAFFLHEQARLLGL